MHASSSFIPAYDLNEPNGGPQRPVTVMPKQKIYSSYTGNLIGIGPIPKGTITDAPPGNPFYKKPFHVIEVNRKGQYMMHQEQNVHEQKIMFFINKRVI